MILNSNVNRGMTGSPSDIAEESQAATGAINECNAQHTEAEGVALLPVKWGTWCDIFIGMFWTKLGTYTGAMFHVYLPVERQNTKNR